VVRLHRSVGGRPSPVNNSMKVLHVIPSLSPQDGGPSFAMPLIARGLERKGINVDVATTVRDEDGSLSNGHSPNGSRPDAADAPVTLNGVNYFYFRRQSGFYKVSLPLSKWISAHICDYDLVHIHALFSYSSYTAARIAKKNRVPYIVRPLGVLNRWGMQNRRKALKRLSFRFIEQPIMRHAAAIHYTSRQERLEAEETGVRNDAVVIPLGVDVSPFRESPGPEPFFEKFPIARDREIILFLSRLDPKKGLDLLLRSFATGDERPATGDGRRSTVDGRHSPLLVIAGDGDEQFIGGLQRSAEELRIADSILWTGFLGGELKLSALAAASMFVLPSYSENFGIALVEAMAAGLPCVMSDQVGIAADAKEYDAGLVVPCEAGALASAMARLLDDSELRDSLGTNGRRLVEERFSIEAMSNSLVELYDRVLSRRATEADATQVPAIDTELTNRGVAKAK
jgi:glycosyltransferase involved in cell wall biosynthesis